MWRKWLRPLGLIGILLPLQAQVPKTVDYTTVKEMAWVGDDIVKQPKGILLVFHGLGAPPVKIEANDEERRFAEQGYLVVMPYYGPWCWMNRQARQMTDAIIDALFAHYRWPADAPIISTGGSMGGMSALLYCRYAKRPITACISNCGVTDIKYHFGERSDLPRTFRSAYWGYDQPFEESMTEHNPIDQVEAMPRIPYFIIHLTGDPAVNFDHHGVPFVEKMKRAGHDIRFKIVDAKGHCGPIPDDVQQEKFRFTHSFVKDRP